MRRRLAVPMIIALMAAGAAPAMAAISTYHPGGGTWTVGTNPANWAQKQSVSHYYHKTKFHSATAGVWASEYKRVYADAGRWANADAVGGRFAQAVAFWGLP